MDKYMYWLDNIVHLGCKAKCRLLDVFHTPDEIYFSDKKLWEKAVSEKKAVFIQEAKDAWDVNGKYEEMLKTKMKMVTIRESVFPEKLKNIPDPPFAIYYLGELPCEELPSVAVIGARDCSEYGKYVAQELGRCLGENGIQVISGMARGIDGISQWSALEAGSKSFGIMGCGADICYPSGNRSLYDRLLENGGILSTYPPGTIPQPKLFPPRNRIVSGLSDVLVVVEARQKSGTAITVDMALEQGRDIYAVPGRVTDRLSDGCNKMLREGAHVFLSPEDFLLEIKELIPEKANNLWRKTEMCTEKENEKEVENNPSDKEERILSVMDLYPRHVDHLAERLQEKYQWHISAAEVNVLLMKMYLQNKIQQEAPGWYYLKCVSGNSRK